MRLSEDFTVLASFDPGTFLLRFNIDLGVTLTDDQVRNLSLQDFIRRNLVSTTSHEFAHFVQGCSTASGVREFFMAVDLAQLGLSALSAATRAGRGTLTVPIATNRELYASSEEFRERMSYYLVAARTISLYMGGQRTRRNKSKHDADRGWLKVEDDVNSFGIHVSAPLFFADMMPISGDPELVLLGGLHLSEGFAKGIEMVQRHLTDEPGMKADPLAPLRSVNPAEFPLANPYFLVHWIYGQFSRTLPKEAQDRSSIEELCAIIDLSLMLDPVVTASTLQRQGEFGAFWGKHRFDYSPMHAFIMLLSVLVSEYRELPKIDQQWRQDQVTTFQNALLKKAGFSLSMLDLTSAALGYVEEVFKHASEKYFFVFPSLSHEYRRSITSFLRWRVEALNGGAVLEDLLTGADQLYRFVLSTVPAFAMGSLIVSTGQEIRPGEGVGVDIVNLHQFRDILQTLISGNNGCPLHGTSPRGCVVPPHNYCEALPSSNSGLERCVRESCFNRILEMLGVTQLIWRS